MEGRVVGEAGRENLAVVNQKPAPLVGPVEEVGGCFPKCRPRGAGPRRWSASAAFARLALRHSQLCRCHAAVGVGGLSGGRAVSPRLWLYALSLRRDVP